jgi:hypothetical protein
VTSDLSPSLEEMKKNKEAKKRKRRKKGRKSHVRLKWLYIQNK